MMANTFRLRGGSQAEKMQESELAAMQWFDMTEIEQMPIFSQGVFKSVLHCCKAYMAGTYSGLAGSIIPNMFTQKTELLLHGPDII